jgi:hypothetical protein
MAKLTTTPLIGHRADRHHAARSSVGMCVPAGWAAATSGYGRYIGRVGALAVGARNRRSADQRCRHGLRRAHRFGFIVEPGFGIGGAGVVGPADRIGRCA